MALDGEAPVDMPILGGGEARERERPEPGKDLERPPEALFSPQRTPEKRAEGSERGKRDERGEECRECSLSERKRTTSSAEQNEGSCEIRDTAWLEGPPQQIPP